MKSPYDNAASSSDWKEYAVAAAFDADAIKTSTATSTSAAEYDGEDLNGAIGAGAIRFAQRITATLSSSVGSYLALPITVEGTDEYGNEITDTMTPSGTDGNETISTTKAFASVTSIAVPAQTDADGALQFGVGDIVLNPPARAVRAVAAGALQLVTPAGELRPLTLAATQREDVLVAEVLRTTAVAFAILR